MAERPDSFAWILGGIGLEMLALGNLIPLSVSSPNGDRTAAGEQDRAHWRGVAEACFGLVIFGTQFLPGGPVPYALMACAAWVCFLSVLAFALRWRWPVRGDGDMRVRV
jgi:hypothetical protein